MEVARTLDAETVKCACGDKGAASGGDAPQEKKKKHRGIDWASVRVQRVLLKIAYIGDAYSVGPLALG